MRFLLVFGEPFARVDRHGLPCRYELQSVPGGLAGAAAPGVQVVVCTTRPIDLFPPGLEPDPPFLPCFAGGTLNPGPKRWKAPCTTGAHRAARERAEHHAGVITEAYARGLARDELARAEAEIEDRLLAPLGLHGKEENRA